MVDNGGRTLKNVGLFVGDEDNEQILQRLIDVSYMLRFNGGVLLSTTGQLGERGDQTLDPCPCHLTELT